MNPRHFLGAACLLGLALSVHAFDFRRDGDTLVLRGRRVEAQIRNARIVSVKELSGGTVLAGEGTPAPSRTAGVGNMMGKEKELSRLHMPWGEPRLNQSLPHDEPISLYRFPTPQSRLAVEPRDSNVTVRWTGLSNGREDYPDDWIEMEFGEDDDGALAFHARAETVAPEVFGLQVPIENLDGHGTLYLAHFGGLEHPASGRPALMTYHGTTLFYEAKFMAYRLGDTTLAFWSEDDTFRPYHVMVGRNGQAGGVSPVRHC